MQIPKRLRTTLSKSLIVLILLAISGCAFDYEHSITPMVWYTSPPQNAYQTPAYQTPVITPLPTPTSIFSVPQPRPTFLGDDSLHCTEPKGGDDHFGFCRIPGTTRYYIWGECEIPCPDNYYDEIEILIVEHSDTFDDFRIVAENRAQAYDDRFDNYVVGGASGVTGIIAGIPAVAKVCIVSGAWSWGWGCILAVALVGADIFVTGRGLKKGHDADESLQDPLGLEFSIRDLFSQLQDLGEPYP
jgi:hypothetical protein